VYVPVQPPPPSRQARELADEVAAAVLQYRDGHPELSALDGRQALRLAQTNLPPGVGGGSPSTGMVILVVIGILGVVAGIAVLMMAKDPSRDPPWMMIAVVGLIVVLGLAALWSKASRR